MRSEWAAIVLRKRLLSSLRYSQTVMSALTEEPYEGNLHARICGGRRGKPRLLPGIETPRKLGSHDSVHSDTRQYKRNTDANIADRRGVRWEDNNWQDATHIRQRTAGAREVRTNHVRGTARTSPPLNS